MLERHRSWAHPQQVPLLTYFQRKHRAGISRATSTIEVLPAADEPETFEYCKKPEWYPWPSFQLLRLFLFGAHSRRVVGNQS